MSSFGYYIWYLPNIAWETDAWARLGVKHRWSSNGGATGSIVVSTEDFGPPDGRGASSEWMHSWTIFYWGWWISWGPFVGTFLARISKGRTLGEFIVGVLILPSVRHHRQIKHGDVLTDMCIAVLFYPLALVQHEKELRAPDDFYGGSLDKESEEKEA